MSNTETKTPVIDNTLYNGFWSKLQQFRFDITYYNIHFNACVRLARIIKYIIVGLTSLATGAWMSWNDIPVVSISCAIIILILQGVSAVSEWFPYEKRKNELRELTTELEPLYLEMESDWRKINCYEVDNEYVLKALDRYAQKQADITRHYLKDDALPERERYHLKADNLTEEYFKYFV